MFCDVKICVMLKSNLVNLPSLSQKLFTIMSKLVHILPTKPTHFLHHLNIFHYLSEDHGNQCVKDVLTGTLHFSVSKTFYHSFVPCCCHFNLGVSTFSPSLSWNVL